QAVWFQAANQANPSLANEMGSDSSLTHCGYDLGTIPAGTTGTVVFAVVTHFQRSTAMSFPVVASEDGTGGTDLDPFNNLFELTFAPSICHRPGGPGCDRCAEGLVCPAPQHCDPRIGCVP